MHQLYKQPYLLEIYYFLEKDDKEMKQAIEKLIDLQKKMKAYIYASSLFEWDQATGESKSRE